jgi:hypothetical protein
MRPAIHLIAVMTVTVFVFPSSPVTAQDYSALWRSPAVENYELTMEKLRKFMEVQRAVGTDPETMAKVDRDFKELAKNNPKLTIADSAALLERQPKVVSALGRAGMAPREYMLTLAAVSNAGLQIALRGRGASPKTAAQKANVALLEKNEAEWKKMEQELARIAEASASKPKR